MGSFLKKIKKNKTNYKNLYEIELNNRKKYEERYRTIKKDYEELQKSSGIAELRVENMKLKEEITRVKIELEDTKGFLAQETQAKEELLKQKNKEEGK